MHNLDSFYWYLEINNNSHFITVIKHNKFIFNTYRFSAEISAVLKKTIKKLLAKCPTDTAYTFEYIERDNTVKLLRCVSVKCISYCNNVQIWKTINGAEFFKFCKLHGIEVPEVYTGQIVFSTLKQLVAEHSLVQLGDVYALPDRSKYLYPLPAVG